MNYSLKIYCESFYPEKPKESFGESIVSITTHKRKKIKMKKQKFWKRRRLLRNSTKVDKK